jgi:hypothetical protein
MWVKIGQIKPRQSIFRVLISGFTAIGIFCAPTASALNWTEISEKIMNNNDLSLEAGATYEVGTPIMSTTGNLVYFENYLGNLNGNGATFTGLVAPLFDLLGSISDSDGASVRDLTLVASTTVSGNGILANTATNSDINSVITTGTINAISDYAGGLVGSLNDGNISNSSSSAEIVSTGSNAGGLVGSLIGDSSIINSNTTGTVSGNNYVGGLVGGTSLTSDVINSYSTANVTGQSYVGGLIGYQNGGTTTGSSSSGQVIGFESLGGLVGYADGVIDGSSSSSDVIASGYTAIGGLVGEGSAHVTNSFATGGVTALTSSYVGGLVGNSSGSISHSYSTGRVQGNDSVGGLIGYTWGATITESFSTSQVDGVNYVGGLVGQLNALSEITNSYSTGDVTGSGSTVGGIAGLGSSSNTDNSYSIGDVSGDSIVGGIYGQAEDGSTVTNTFALGDINVWGSQGGGIVGASYDSTIANAVATGNVTGTTWTQQLGGIAGYSHSSTFEDVSYTGVISGGLYLGGLLGYSDLNSEIIRGNVIASITGDSYLGGVTGFAETGFHLSESSAEVDIEGTEAIGGLIGYARGGSSASDIELNNSHWKGNLQSSVNEIYTGSVIAYAARNDDLSSYPYYATVEPVVDESYGYFAAKLNGVNVVGRINAPTWDGDVNIPEPTSVLQNFASQRISGNTWAICSRLNGSNPYLLSLYPTDPCGVINPQRGILGLSSRIELEPKPIERIEKTIGFNDQTTLLKNSQIIFIQETEKTDLATVKAIEIVPTANVKVNAKTGEALQISLKSESKEPVELWVKSPDGTWLLAGVITFDKDGKAILPPLQFKNVGDYTLVLNKPSADSAKGSAPLNQSGSVLVAVS